MVLLLFDRNVQELCPSLIQPSPGQPSGFFLLCFGRGGREREGGIRLAGQKNPPAERTLASKLGHRVMALSRCLQPKHQGYLPPTLLLSFFVDALFILPLLLLLRLLLLLFCNYACEGVDLIITELLGRS